MGEIIGMFGIHNGSWMTSSRDLVDAVRDYDYDLGGAVEEQFYWANNCINECEELEQKNWDLREKVERLEEENTKLENRYDDLDLEYAELKKNYDILEEENRVLQKKLEWHVGTPVFHRKENDMVTKKFVPNNLACEYLMMGGMVEANGDLFREKDVLEEDFSQPILFGDTEYEIESEYWCDTEEWVNVKLKNGACISLGADEYKKAVIGG